MSDPSIDSAVQAVLAVHQAQEITQAQTQVLRKAMDNAASNISSLIDSLPQPPQPPLATSGHLGTQLNAYA